MVLYSSRFSHLAVSDFFTVPSRYISSFKYCNTYLGPPKFSLGKLQIIPILVRLSSRQTVPLMSWTSINRIFEFYSLIKVSLPGDNFYVWLYTPVPWYRSYPKLTILSTVLAVTLSPIWPAQIRLFYLAVYIIYMIYKN